MEHEGKAEIARQEAEKERAKEYSGEKPMSEKEFIAIFMESFLYSQGDEKLQNYFFYWLHEEFPHVDFSGSSWGNVLGDVTKTIVKLFKTSQHDKPGAVVYHEDGETVATQDLIYEPFCKLLNGNREEGEQTISGDDLLKEIISLLQARDEKYKDQERKFNSRGKGYSYLDAILEKKATVKSIAFQTLFERLRNYRGGHGGKLAVLDS